MKMSHLPSVENSAHEIYSEGWRTQEAKDIFNLLRNEYNNSKRLNVVKRYKELERIINMFTSEPVLMKLLWFTSDEMEAFSSSQDSETEVDVEADKDGSESHSDCENLRWQNQSQISREKVINGLKHLCTTARIKSVGPIFSAMRLINPNNSSDSELPADSDDGIPSTCMEECDLSRLPWCNSPFSSNVFTPSVPLKSPSSHSITSSCFLFNTGAPFDVETSSCRAALHSYGSLESNCNCSNSTYLDNNSGNSQNSSPSTGAKTSDAKDSSSSKRRGIETCIIRRNEIPLFQIPPQRTFAEELPKLDPSFYPEENFSRNSRNTSCCCKRNIQPFIKISVSTPNMIGRRLSTVGTKLRGIVSGTHRQKRCCSDNSIQNSRLESACLFLDNEYLLKHQTAANNSKKISCTDSFYQDDCLTASNLTQAYENLRRMKTEFHQLNDKNVLTRYSKMKSIIKTCMDTQL